MSLFKKPKRNFRARQTHNSESGDENHDASANVEAEDGDEPTSVFQATANMRKSLNKKKKNRNKIDDSDLATIKHKSTLSFGEEINEDDSFKVKKSSRSKMRAKQLKKESRREREEEEKVKKEALIKAVSQISERNGTNAPEDMDVSEDGKSDSNSNSSHDSEEEKEEERKKRAVFDRVLKSGAIPDAHMIHMARKKRQQAREFGDFVPLEEERPVSGSRLIREEDHDHSDDDDEPLSFSVNTREKELRKMQESIITAQEERSNSEESDHEREWEEQQIRKAVSIPQVASTADTNTTGSNGTGANSTSFDQYIYGQSSNIFNQNAPEYISSAPPAVSTQQKLTNLPVSLDLVKKSLQDRLDSLNSVHRAHRNERDDIVSRLESCESSIVKCKDSQGGLEDQYRFFQEMRGYVRDLVECLNEKVPSINYLERSMNHQLKSRAESLVTRRQDDLKDQSEDVKLAFQNRMPNIVVDPEKQRRVAEREARRARRRRARETRGIKCHHEGMSTDDEENQANESKFKMAKEQIDHDIETMFSDVNEEFYQLDLIRHRFEDWKYRYSDTYDQAYIGLCLPKLFTPFLRLEMINWNPIEDNNCEDFEEMRWYESLMFYGYRDGEGLDRSDTDLKLIPSLIEKVLLPKLTDQADKVWDPLSSHQTLNLAHITKRLIRDYPSITAESKNTQDLLRTIVRRLRKTLSDDVFIPLCNKQMMESKSSPSYIFAHRQFWTCIKLLSNLVVWQGMLSDRVVKELTLESLLNRYLLLALQTALNTGTPEEVMYKSQAVVSCLPKPWFTEVSRDITLPQLAMLCRFLNSFAEVFGKKALALKEDERQEGRESLRQIARMLLAINGIEHATALSEKYSFKLER